MPTLKLKLSRHKHRKPLSRPPIPDPRKPYHAPSLYARVLAKLLSKNQIRELQEAQRLFGLRADPGAAAACASMCFEIVDERPSEAVAARAHGMLAVRGVGGLADARRYHASEAVDCWRRVIDRTGRSRFDVEKAREGLRSAEELLRQAEVDCVEYEETAATMLY